LSHITAELTQRRDFFFLLPFSFCLWLALPPLASNDLFDGADLTVKVNSETSISLRLSD